MVILPSLKMAMTFKDDDTIGEKKVKLENTLNFYKLPKFATTHLFPNFFLMYNYTV